jgi:hypothetical protein
MSATPEFVRWALRHACTPRADAPLDDVERIARQLFVLRECGQAIAEQRVVGDYVLARETLDAKQDGATVEPCGFRVTEVLAAYGGWSSVDQACGQCPVNLGASASDDGDESSRWASTLRGPNSRWANCFGVVDWRAWGETCFERVEQYQRQLAPLEQWEARFLPTSPTWYGLWIGSAHSDSSPPNHASAHSPALAYTREQLEWLERLWEKCVAEMTDAEAVVGPFLAAIRRALTTGAELRAKLYPRGELAGKRWRVAAHCGRCGASWSDERAAAAVRVCPVCRLAAAPLAARSRAAQGTRPYGPLARIVGRDEAAELLARYWRQRGGAS